MRTEIWTWACVQTSMNFSSVRSMSTVWMNASFSMMTNFFLCISLLSIVMMEMISRDLFSIAVYVQYWAQCPGLSIRPSAGSDQFSLNLRFTYQHVNDFWEHNHHKFKSCTSPTITTSLSCRRCTISAFFVIPDLLYCVHTTGVLDSAVSVSVHHSNVHKFEK